MTQVYSCSQSGPLRLTSPHDPNASEFYTLSYRPRQWQANRVYRETVCGDVGEQVAPSPHNGFLYTVQSGGVSGPTQPIWPTKTGDTIEDGTITWETVADISNLGPLDTIAQSVWECDLPAITLSDDGVAAGITYVKVSDVPANEEQFILTNRVTINREGGFVETIDRSLRVKIKET